MSYLKIKWSRAFGFVLLLLVLVGTSCKSRKEGKKPPPQVQKLAQVDSVFLAMKAAEFTFDTLVAKFSGIYNFDGKKQNFSGQLRMVYDSMIWCSIMVMNIEVARVVVTTDTVKMLNRLARNYYVANFDLINQQLNTDIDFDMLQALLLGNDIPYYETDKFNLEVRPELYVLNTIARRKLRKHVTTDEDLEKVLVQKMKIDRRNLRILQQNIKQVRNPNKKVVAEYSAFENHDGLFPTQMEFKFIGVKELKVDFRFTRIQKKKETRFPFKIPSSYSKAETEK